MNKLCSRNKNIPCIKKYKINAKTTSVLQILLIALLIDRDKVEY